MGQRCLVAHFCFQVPPVVLELVNFVSGNFLTGISMSADGINELPPDLGRVRISEWHSGSVAVGTYKWPPDPGAYFDRRDILVDTTIEGASPSHARQE